MDLKIIFNLQKDLLKAILYEKHKDWYVSEGTNHIAILQKTWVTFIPKKDFYLDYRKISEKVHEYKRFCENCLQLYQAAIKIPLIYLTSTNIHLPNEAGKEKEVAVDIFEEDVASGKRIYINSKLLRYLPESYGYYNFISLKESNMIFITDKKDNIIMAAMPIKLIGGNQHEKIN